MSECVHEVGASGELCAATVDINCVRTASCVIFGATANWGFQTGRCLFTCWTSEIPATVSCRACSSCCWRTGIEQSTMPRAGSASLSCWALTCFVSTLAGLRIPATLRMRTCPRVTSSWTYTCDTSKWRSFELSPILFDAASAAAESVYNRGVATSWILKSISARALRKTISLAALDEPRISPSAELVAGSPGCVWLEQRTTVPPITQTTPSVVRRVRVSPAQSLSAKVSKLSGPFHSSR